MMPGSPSMSTSTGSIWVSARRTSPRVQPVHHLMSATVAGPNVASHRRTSSTLACAWGSRGMPSGSHRSAGAQRNWPDTHEPRGRPRTTRPSAASRNSTRGDNRHIALLVVQLDAQPWLVGGQLGAQRLATCHERLVGGHLDVGEPTLRVLDAIRVLPEVLNQLAPFGRGNGV